MKPIVDKKLAADEIAKRIAGRILKSQHKAADFLNERVRGISPNLVLSLLAVFALSIATYCIFLILGICQ